MTFSQKAVEAAAEAMKQRRRDEIERGRERASYEQMAELALTAALAAEGVALVDISILRDMQEAIEQTEDWHVANTDNWLLYHQIGALIDAAASDREERPSPAQEPR